MSARLAAAYTVTVTVSRSRIGMFSLLRGFYEYYTRKPSFNILIIGLDSSGKTVNKK